MEQQNCYFGKDNRSLTVTRTQLPNYDTHLWVLADRSIGHALASLGVFYAYGHDTDAEHLLAFFEHFLTARQLNDDAHAWQEDLRRGLINSVVERLILSKLNILPIQEMAPPELHQRLSVHLWKCEMVGLFENIQSELQAARQELEFCSLIYPEFLIDLLKPIEQATSRAFEGRNRVLTFINIFSKVK